MLIELLVVIAIIAVLVGLLLPAVQKVRPAGDVVSRDERAWVSGEAALAIDRAIGQALGQLPGTRSSRH